MSHRPSILQQIAVLGVFVYDGATAGGRRQRRRVFWGPPTRGCLVKGKGVACVGFGRSAVHLRRRVARVTPGAIASAGAESVCRIQPCLRSNARAVDRSLAMKIRYSGSDAPRGHCTRLMRRHQAFALAPGQEIGVHPARYYILNLTHSIVNSGSTVYTPIAVKFLS